MNKQRQNYLDDEVTLEGFLACSYRELYQRTGIRDHYWSNWFRRGQDPMFGTMRVAAEGLKIPVHEFVRLFMARRAATLAGQVNGKTAE